MLQIKDGKLIIKKKRCFEFIPLSKILFLERFNHKTYLHLDNNIEIIINSTLKELELILPQNFKRSHRSFIINKDHLEGLIVLNPKTYEANFPNDKQALVLREYVSHFI